MKTTEKTKGITYYDLMIESPDEAPDTKVGTYRTEEIALKRKSEYAEKNAIDEDYIYVEMGILVFNK